MNRSAIVAALRGGSLWRKAVPFALAATALMAACVGSAERSEYSAVGSAGWVYADTIAYAPADTLCRPCNVAVALRHTNGYEYSNIWLELTYSPQPDSLRRDTFNIRLADPLGRWLGTGIGVGYQKIDTVLRGASINLAEPLLLRHIMRADTLPGIEQAGIVVTAI